MKKIILAASALLLTVTVMLLLQGCLKDSGKKTYTYYTPVIHTSAQVRASIKSGVAQATSSPGKIYVLGNTIFMAESGKGIHIIDNSNPSNPVNKWFINIPGNEDMAVSGNILYADCYTDLLAIDISKPDNVTLKNYVTNVYPEKRYVNGYYVDSGKVVTDWIRHDTTVDANIPGNYYPTYYDVAGAQYLTSAANSSSSKSTTTGVAGSMSKLAIVQNRLYSTDQGVLSIFNISDAGSSSYLSRTTQVIYGNSETIYPFQDKLFIGTTTGMNIFSIDNPDQPKLLGIFWHATCCDPVITDGTNAFVTLRSNGTMCGGTKNELDVVDVRNVMSPSLIKTYSMSSPKGLAKDGDILFVCDDMLKMYDASNTSNLQLKKSFVINTPYDVICLNKIAIVTAADGLYQFDYSNLSDVKLLSKLKLNSNP